MSEEQIEADIIEKEKVLRWMVENNIESLTKIGLLMTKYYRGALKIS